MLFRTNKIIKKPNYVKSQANLADYEKTNRNFSWKEEEKTFAEGAHYLLNAGFIAADLNCESYRKNKIALFWEGENGASKSFTFSDISISSNKFGNLLKKFGVRKKDRVFLFLPRIPELYISFLAILKIGAVAGTLFPAFGEQALFDRLKNSGTKVLITTKELSIRLKGIRHKLPDLKKVILVDENYWKLLEKEEEKLNICHMEPQDPAFMLYTSATGNTPVCGIVIPHIAIVQQQMTAKWTLDLKDEDTYWCTADPGWVTGSVYGILAPWSLGTTQLVYEGRFDAAKWYSLIEKYKITVFYTAPTAIRMLQEKEQIIKKFNLSTLRHICSVGEALTPFSISWAVRHLRLPIHDTWWQTETGAMMITNFPSVDIKPGSMGKSMPGIKAFIIDDHGKELKDGKAGNLAFKPHWPSMMETIWKNKKLYKSYFKHGFYLTGDLACRDKDGYFWFVGRSKDIIKTSGERIGPFEVESALCDHPAVLEAGVIGKPDKLRGEIIKAFIVLKEGVKPSENLKTEIVDFVKKDLAGHAYPREIDFIDKLPKNRSGKIVRRILKAKELGLPVGDTSTLVED